MCHIDHTSSHRCGNSNTCVDGDYLLNMTEVKRAVTTTTTAATTTITVAATAAVVAACA